MAMKKLWLTIIGIAFFSTVASAGVLLPKVGSSIPNALAGKRLDGASCTANNECVSNNCSDGKCLAAIPLGGACTDAGQCFAGSDGCWQGRCTGKNLAGGQWCNNGNQCAANVCNNNVCGATNVQLGGACTDAGQCFAGSSGCWQGRCTGKNLAGGQWCNNSNQCVSGNCSGWKCQP